MKNRIIAFCAIAAMLPVAACSSYHDDPPPGQYTHTEKSTDMQGDQTQTRTDTNVYYDQYGHKRAVEQTQTTQDPNGLFNKSTTTTTTSKTYN